MALALEAALPGSDGFTDVLASGAADFSDGLADVDEDPGRAGNSQDQSFENADAQGDEFTHVSSLRDELQALLGLSELGV